MQTSNLKITRSSSRLFSINSLASESDQTVQDLLKSLTREEKEYLTSWNCQARDEQLPPDEWGENGCFIWNIRCGRGWGKTKTGAETIIMAVRDWGYKFPNLVGATAEDVRDLMINGESGILSCAPESFMPEYKKSEKKLIWPNGVESRVYYGSEPNKARGPQSDFLWVDELAKYLYPEDTFDNLLLGLRLGPCPLCMITSTPQPTKFLMELEKRVDEEGNPTCVVTRGNTDDNYVNLSPVFINTVISKYKGTRLGRQELDGAFLDENPDALWKQTTIDETRVRPPYRPPPLEYIVVGVDPAATSKEGSDDTGIIVAGRGTDRHGYVLGDYTMHDRPAKWGAEVIRAYYSHEANLVVGETNNGGEMVEETIKVIDLSIPFESIHASRGKALRAEPVSALYELGRVHHYGTFKDLESQMTQWVPGAEKSPDRVDALVYSISQLDLYAYIGQDQKNEDPGYSFASTQPEGIWDEMF